ncbi:AMP-binding protein, partial [Paenibacillus sp. Leaf72]|uniref:AMP-binding protein n=1 Tax=Paenibacillus sp. Leaf72 TaxID=1736234 RepID=UPI00228608EF
MLLSRSPWLIAGLLGIMKAGAAYVPLDPALPAGRIEGMVRDAGIRILLSEKAQRETVAGWVETPLRQVLCLEEQATSGRQKEQISDADGQQEGYASDGQQKDDDSQVRFASVEELNAYSTTATKVETRAEGSAYVIYTSGTTGTPKGVVVEHRNVVNFMTGMVEALPFAPSATMLSVTTVSFDIFVTESWVPLSCGMQVLLASEAEQQDPAQLAALLTKHPAQVMQTTPSRLVML